MYALALKANDRNERAGSEASVVAGSAVSCCREFPRAFGIFFRE